ncbi:cob(I)yrinic acid a,c-diamide adenosyltransferase [Pareuzebyella sediminis]|uniref:cob(I)yrinic acid a,c-diamide adenosyltransferase n=1 Tax=Pareuzebyella sediminis TaxID=2607998 RepID=UPI0011EFFD29|nr:cob(I)yrinic acid a,c-diamide adenosyltransferase [Pareuzebyella sediminis]
MKIYTKTGDDGSTALIGGKRVKKHHIRIESYGTVDELNSWLGLIRDQEIDESSQTDLVYLQNRLFIIGALLATDPKKKENRSTLPKLEATDVEWLERRIDQMTENLAPLTHFILPGGHTIVSYCHIARTVCRRAERISTLLHENEPFERHALVFLNRLSDYLFVLARKLSKSLEAEEIKWIPKKAGDSSTDKEVK